MSWSTETPGRCFTEECSWVKKQAVPRIVISKEVWSVLVELTRQVKDEWQALLSGTESDGVVNVTGYWIPLQEVSSAAVINLDVIDESVVRARSLVATIHSHSNMSVFHSETDIESTCKSALIKHHITMNNRLELVSKSQAALPCGQIGFVTSQVSVEGAAPVTIEGLERIKKAAERFPSWDDKSDGLYVRNQYTGQYELSCGVPARRWLDTDVSYMESQREYELRGTVVVSPFHIYGKHEGGA